jgi:hypothetical protein
LSKPLDEADSSSGAKEAAEKLRIDSERAKFGGCKTINQPSRIVPGASWRDLFFAPFERLSFSAACKAHTDLAGIAASFSKLPRS